MHDSYSHLVEKMESVLISVIVPVYGVELYLDRCVRSIIDQTYQSIEIILVDDGSPDNCPAMCEAWAKKDSRVKVIHKENGGLSDARNAGITAANGEYIAFIDSDDWIAPEMLERLFQAIQRDDSDIAACTVEMVWDDGSPNHLLTVRTNCVLNRLEAQRALLEESLLKQPVWYKLYRRETIQEIPFEVGKYHEDVFWSYQAIGNADRVSIIDYVGYFYYQRKDSIMGNGYSLKRLDVLEACRKRYEYIRVAFPSLERSAKQRIVANCIYQGQMALLYLSKEEQEIAFACLDRVKRDYPLNKHSLSGVKATHRVWLRMSQISLRLTCRVKNALKVGL